MILYIAVQNDKPIPAGALSDELKVIQQAQEWANYSKRRVSILKVTPPFVDLHQIVIPDEG